MTGFATPNYSENKMKRFKLTAPKDRNEETSNVFRFLPAYGPLAAKQQHRAYHAVHYGYKGTGDEGGKLRQRPFACVEVRNWRTKTTEVSCPQCDLWNARKAEFEMRKKKIEVEGAQANKSEAQVKEEVSARLGDLQEWMKDYNVDRKHYYAVMNEAGEFGSLSLSGTTKDKLESLFRAVREEGADALAIDQGVWVNIKRRGLGRDTEDTPVAVREKVEVQGRTFMDIKRRPLSEEEVARALNVLIPLDQLTTVLTKDQVQRLVSCSGDPEEVDAIFDEGASTKPVRETVAAKVPMSAPMEPKASPKAAPKAPPTPPPEPEAPAAEDDEEAEMLRKLVEIKARKAKATEVKPQPAAKAPEPVRKSEPPPAEEEAGDPPDDDSMDLDPEAFLKRYAAKFPHPAG